MRRRWGASTLLVGLALVAAGYLWVAAFPTPDANIGAGLLVLLGGAVAVVGAVLLVVALVLALRRRRPRPTSSSH